MKKIKYYICIILLCMGCSTIEPYERDTYYNIIFNEDGDMEKLTTHSYGYSFKKVKPESKNRPEYKLKKEQLGFIDENRSVIMDLV